MQEPEKAPPGGELPQEAKAAIPEEVTKQKGGPSGMGTPWRDSIFVNPFFPIKPGESDADKESKRWEMIRRLARERARAEKKSKIESNWKKKMVEQLRFSCVASSTNNF